MASGLVPKTDMTLSFAILVLQWFTGGGVDGRVVLVALEGALYEDAHGDGGGGGYDHEVEPHGAAGSQHDGAEE